MKKKYFVFILIVMIFPQLNAQIFYNIEMPLSYRNMKITDIIDLPSIKYDVDHKGNLIKDKLSTNVKDYLKIDKIGEKNIARLKFTIDALSLGEMTLRFGNVILNSKSHCFVYTSDYEIVAGPVYEKSIDNVLNIVNIPAKELILEIVFKDIKDFELTLNSISYQSLIDISKKNDNSLQSAVPNWICDSCIRGRVGFFDNAGLDTNYKSWFGAGYKGELFKHINLYSVNDVKQETARASCMIMIPTVSNTYVECCSGTLINFPGTDCNGVIISARHLGQVLSICEYQQALNGDAIDTTYLKDSIANYYRFYLNNTIIRFNWHHKYGKPLHLINKCKPTPEEFILWRKTIDFDEVVDYCGVKGFAYSVNENCDYAIIKMQQEPFYKELHLGWSSQKYFETISPTSKTLKYPERYMILGRQAATPTYVYKTQWATLENPVPSQVTGIDLVLHHLNEDQINMEGWSGSQLIYLPDYPNAIPANNSWIGIGITKRFGTYRSSVSLNYSYNFNYVSTNPSYMNSVAIVDPDLPIAKRGTDTNLYTGYLREHKDKLTVVTGSNGFYWMPSKENREKCPSTMTSETERCDFNFKNFISVTQKDGKVKVIIKISGIGGISPGDFPGGQYPKGIRIYNALGDQQTYFFDTFADSIDIGPTIEFTISQCDLLYYQIMGYTSLLLGFDFYDITGKILNDHGCNMTYSFPFTKTNPCEGISITTEKIPSWECCTYKIRIKFEGCDDYSNIFRLFLENSSFINLNTQDTTALSTQSSFISDYNTGEISFMINDICDTTSFKIVKSFGNNFDCGSLDFTLVCELGYPMVDCCMYFGLTLLPVFECDSNNSFDIKSNKFMIDFSGLDFGPIIWPQCLFISAHVYSPNPNPNITIPIYDEIITPPEDGFYKGDLGSFEGSNPGTYCFYSELLTNTGICYDTICVYYNGTTWEYTPAPPGPIIYIDEGNDNNQLPLSIKLEYEEVTITDINGAILIESEPIDKIDVSKLKEGTYYILYRKKGKVIQSQKIIIK